MKSQTALFLAAWRVAALLALGGAAARGAETSAPAIELRRGDVVAFVGGADVAAAQFSGHLESILAVKARGLGVRFRNFGWEGDTVYAQPRDVGFPPLAQHLRKAGATLVVFQFGRMESFGGPAKLPEFAAAYEKLVDELGGPDSRQALVTPPPFEKGGGYLPDLSARNEGLAAYVAAIREIGGRRGLPVVDLFAELGGAGHREPRLTGDGLQLAPRGEGLVARAFAQAAGMGEIARLAGEIGPEGQWSNPAFERLRQAVVAKNRLWFDYWRPENWAFLGGDRTEQPSSRDHRDRNIRWFPAEMEKFVPLITEAEAKIDQAAAKTSDAPGDATK